VIILWLNELMFENSFLSSFLSFIIEILKRVPYTLVG